jgi:hypothetical protein
MLSDIQQKAMSRNDVELGHSLELVDYISQVGFGVVDEMEGVVRYPYAGRAAFADPLNA